MSTETYSQHHFNDSSPGQTILPRIFIAPIPLFLLQPMFRRIVRHIAKIHPELFDRLGPHQDKRFLIDPVNMPFVLCLCPDSEHPELTAHRRHEEIQYDAKIAGTFLTLLDMVDGELDGDALFFSRDLVIEGNTEAVVTLRNALDDIDSSIAEDIASIYGPVGRAALKTLRRIRK